MRAFLTLVLCLLVSVHAGAGEVLTAEAVHKDGWYELTIAVLIEGDPDTVHAIATAYDEVAALSEIIRSAATLELRQEADGDVVRHQMTTRT